MFNYTLKKVAANLFVGVFLVFIMQQKTAAQQYNIKNTWSDATIGYASYNLFDTKNTTNILSGTTTATTSTSFAPGFAPDPSVSANNTSIITSASLAANNLSALVGSGNCLESKHQTTAKSIAINFLDPNTSNSTTAPNSTGTAFSTFKSTITSNTYDWEWSFIYKTSLSAASITGGNASTAAIASGASSWRYWIHASTASISNATAGYYLTENSSGQILLVAKAGSGSATTIITSNTTVAANTTYIIKVQRLTQTRWLMFMDVYSSSTTEASTMQGGASAGTWNTFNSDQISTFDYVNSVLEAENANGSDGAFKFDELKMYTRHIELTPISDASYGVSQSPLYAGESAIMFGMELDIRGTYVFGNQVSFNATITSGGSGLQNNFSGNATLYKTTSSTFSTSTGTSVGTSSNFFTGSGNPITIVNNQNVWSTSGNYDGTVNTPGYYFLAATVASPIPSGNMGNSYKFTSINTLSENNNNNAVSGIISNAGTTQTETFGDTYDWIGATSTAWSLNANWKKNGVANVSFPSTSTDVVRIGVSAYSANNQPILGSTQSIGSMEFGKLGSTSGSTAAQITLDFNGFNLTASKGTTFDASASLQLTNSSSTTASTFTIQNTSTMASTAILSFNTAITKGITIANSGTFTLNSDASGTALIGTLPSNSSITGSSFVVQRFITGGSIAKRTWRVLSSPVFNTSASPNTYNLDANLDDKLIVTGPGGSGSGFDPPSSWGTNYTTNGVTILTYNGTKFSTSVTSTTTAPVGSSFYFYFRGDRINNRYSKFTRVNGSFATPESVSAQWTGTLNTGTISLPTSSLASPYAIGKFVMLGNPYPCTIKVGTTATTFYTNNHLNLANTGGNLITTWKWDYTTNATNTTIALGNADVASGEGFFVKLTTATPTILFTEDMKSTAAADQPGGTGGVTLLMGIPKPTDDPFIRLSMIQDSAHADLAYVRFNDSYSPNYADGEDIDDISGQGQTVFFGCMTADNKEVEVNSMPLGKQKTSYFLSVNGSSSGLYTIKKLDISGIPRAYDVFLMDHFKNDSLDLRNNSTYNFNIDYNNAATYGNSRFEVVIRKKVLPPYQLVSFTGKNTATGNQLNWTTVNEDFYTTFQVMESTDNGSNYYAIATIQSDSTGKYSYFDKHPGNPAMYKLWQSDINDVVTYSNIVIVSSTPGSQASFVIYPNPSSSSIQFNLQQAVNGNIKLNIYNSMGALVKSAVYTSSTGQQDVSGLISGFYTIEAVNANNKKSLGKAKFLKQ